MATKYTLYFSDTTKTPFDLQAYTTNGPESPSDPSIIAGATTAGTTLKLWGKGLPEYGEPIFQDLVYMLENFANTSAPVFPIEGQLWYNNDTTGSPPLPRLSAYNSSTWDDVILSNGASAMQTGKELILGTDPSSLLGAATKQYVDSTTAPAVHLHAWAEITDAAAAATLVELGTLNGIGTNIQTQLDGKVNLSGGNNMDGTGSITFTGGEVFGLPAVPSVDGAASSKKYVDDQLATGAGGDGVLTQVEWFDTGGGAVVLTENTLQLTVEIPSGSPSSVVFQANGISRTGHTHDAIEVPIDNTFNIAYGSDVQAALEYINVQLGGTQIPTATIAVERIFELLAADITSSAPWEVQGHFADDSRTAITVNGVKQYAHTRGTQSIIYDAIYPYTGLVASTTYEFNIEIDGGAATTITLNPQGGSPLVDLSTHDLLVTEINNQLSAGSPPLGVEFSIDSTTSEIFTALTSGTGSSISITDPGGSPSTYLFDIDSSPSAITAATFLSNIVDAGSPPGSPAPLPDDITIAGDVTASFPVGKTFTIRDSSDPTYGSYDGIYSVHINGAVFGGANTVIPIALVNDPTTITPLLPLYNPNFGSPAPTPPAPSAFGDVYLSPLGGIIEVATAADGIEGDYMETDVSGNPVESGSTTSYVVFNYDILTGSKIESLLYV